MYTYMTLIDVRLLATYSSLIFLGIIYSYAWKKLYTRAIDAQSLVKVSFFEALRSPGYLLLLIYAIDASFPYMPKALMVEFGLTESSFKAFFPISVTVFILWVFNQFLTQIQNRIKALEKSQIVPNAQAWVSACKLGRIISAVIFAFVLMYHLKIPMGQLLAPTAIGALALSFASQDVLSNVFGGLVVLCDRPFSVGDFVQIGSEEVGTVSYIGWRMTEVQLMNGRILHVPNGIITKSVVTNYSDKTHWFVQKEFGLRYQDFEQSAAVAREITEWLRAHKSIHKRKVSFANVFELEESSVVIRVRVYLKSSISTSDWYNFVEELLLTIHTIVKKQDADFAFPTRTVLMDNK